jgi:hypothetical protein
VVGVYGEVLLPVAPFLLVDEPHVLQGRIATAAPPSIGNVRDVAAIAGELLQARRGGNRLKAVDIVQRACDQMRQMVQQFEAIVIGVEGIDVKQLREWHALQEGNGGHTVVVRQRQECATDQMELYQLRHGVGTDEVQQHEQIA